MVLNGSVCAIFKKIQLLQGYLMSLTVFLVSWVVWFILVSFSIGMKNAQNIAKYGEVADPRKHPVGALIGWLISSGLYALLTSWIISKL